LEAEVHIFVQNIRLDINKMKEPFIILLVLFILVGLAYGPLKMANQNKTTDTKNTSSVGTPNGTTSQNPGSSSNKEIAGEIKNTEADIKKLQENLNKQTEKDQRSPNFGKITISGVSGLYGNDPNQEYISIFTNLNKTETVKITGWYLRSEVTGYFAVIGKAALLPFPFTNTESDVILQQGDRVYLTKGFSPIGISFRTDKCTGYFEENRTFTPSLSLQCPRPQDEKLPTFSNIYDRNDECLSIIDRIPRCTTIDSKFIRDLPDTVTSVCKTYITTQISYSTCIARHFGDTDFPGNEYRLYLNKFGPLWRTTHDTIDLHDENGLIVATIKY
jgi:hypothetical protein